MKTRALRRDIAKPRSNCRLHRADFTPKGAVANDIGRHSAASVSPMQSAPPRLGPNERPRAACSHPTSRRAIRLQSARRRTHLKSARCQSAIVNSFPRLAHCSLHRTTHLEHSSESRSGATVNYFEPPVNSKNTGERSPSPVAPGVSRNPGASSDRKSVV